MLTILSIMLGGAIGAMSRYSIGLLISKKKNHSGFPVSMIIVNWIGSFGLGISVHFINGLYPHAQSFITIGFFGALTTYSTFSVEAVELILEKKYVSGLSYILLTFIGSIGLYFLGVSWF
ncbi:fluoride efflux transporter CrcB [Cytobacillus sp. Hm23]